MKRLGWLLLALLAGAILVGTGVWAMARPSRAIPTSPTPLPVSSLPRAETPGAAASASPALPAEFADGAVLALVNGEALGRADLTQALAVDRALASLVGTPVSDEATTLQRLVNERLVRQAARQAGFAVPETQVTAALQEFLTARSLAPETLDAALAAEGISREAFNAYFGALLLVQQFSAAQAQAAGITVAEYVNRLRQAATVELAPVTALPPAELPATPTALPAASPTPATPELPRGIEPGQYAPDFSLPLLGDATGQRLTWAGLVGHPTILSFWVSWCGHCQAQTPVLVEAYQKYAPLGVTFVGINVQEAAETAQAYVNEHQIPYSIALDGDGAVAGAYQLPGYPTTYFLDAEGRVVARHIGQLAAGDVENYVGQLLAAQTP